MPIYEFYCESCNTVFSFFSSRIDTSASPACPRCARPELPRKPSRFAGISKRSGDAADAGEEFGADDPLAGEMEGLDDSAQQDPKQMIRFLERFQQATGLEAGPKMEEMLARLREGKDVDELESEFGGSEGEGGDYGEEGPGGGADDDFSDFFRKKRLARASRKPKVDETLYFL